eukprot:TRINITY_DN14325_c0_g1_i4.p2 TRINITY_DN14325_c0_g1~~TRINITY_DN14325_c0_g1_i4.p2  ORF type:complete len:117 (-),score=39.76 TRINITY_DN14325_c0_g1_i4:76-393(-)
MDDDYKSMFESEKSARQQLLIRYEEYQTATNKQLDTLKSQLDASQKECRDLTKELYDTKASNQQLKTGNSDLTTKNTALSQENARLNDRLKTETQVCCFLALGTL